jgi:ABC-type uncharacterized transport system permease subunit
LRLDLALALSLTLASIGQSMSEQTRLTNVGVGGACALCVVECRVQKQTIPSGWIYRLSVANKPTLGKRRSLSVERM